MLTSFVLTMAIAAPVPVAPPAAAPGPVPRLVEVKAADGKVTIDVRRTEKQKVQVGIAIGGAPGAAPAPPAVATREIAVQKMVSVELGAVKDLAIQSGRADAVFSVNATQAYSAGNNGKTKLVGTVSGGWPITAEIAVTTRKGSGLAGPLTNVLNDLIASGAYTKVLDTWNLGPEAITEAKTNPQGLPKSGS